MVEFYRRGVVIRSFPVADERKRSSKRDNGSFIKR